MRAASANSNASAMFVARNVFSISFAISAASALETAWISEQVWRSTCAARLKHSSVTPPTTRGRGLLGVGLDARVDALGGEGDVDVLAGDQAAAGERLDEHAGASSRSTSSR